MELKTTRDQRGWLVKYLVALDHLFYRRWQYWTDICQSNSLTKEPIPAIRFQAAHAYPQKQVSKNLRKCLNYTANLSNPLEAFIDWILWGFNQGGCFPHISEKEDDYWYRNFNLGLFYLEPADHFGDLAAEYMGRNNAPGYFATPGEVVEMMVRITFDGEPRPGHKTMSVCEPCCGTGVMLLYASNYSLNLYGTDISGLLTKIAIVNAFIYVPWLVFRPKYLTIFDQPKDAIVEIELPTGVRIPECRKCNSRTFVMDLETKHEIQVANGTLRIDKPCLTQDLIARHLKPENITCAECYRKFMRDNDGEDL